MTENPFPHFFCYQQSLPNNNILLENMGHHKVKILRSQGLSITSYSNHSLIQSLYSTSEANQHKTTLPVHQQGGSIRACFLPKYQTLINHMKLKASTSLVKDNLFLLQNLLMSLQLPFTRVMIFEWDFSNSFWVTKL